MILDTLLRSLLPKTLSIFEYAAALTVIRTAATINIAMLLLVLYWVITRTLETINTIFVMLGVMLLLSLCIGLEIRGYVSAGAWVLVIITLLLNFANMGLYGISTSSSSAFTLSILPAFFCLGPIAGYAVTGLGCILVFAIPLLQAKGLIRLMVPYQASNLSFDAPSLTLIYIITAVIAAGWSRSIISMSAS